MPHDPVWTEDLELEDDTDKLIRLALLAEAGLTLEEARAYESVIGKEAS